MRFLSALKQARILVILVILVLGTCIACKQKQEPRETNSKKETEETLLKINRALVKTEDQKIEDFISRYRWEMEETGTGLRYMIYHAGTGAPAVTGKTAEIAYTVGLLDGQTVYSSEESGPKSFVIGKGGVESGLEEGILLLKEGDRAKFIIPSHLAYGLLGDTGKIPAKAVLVYDVELLNIK